MPIRIPIGSASAVEIANPIVIRTKLVRASSQSVPSLTASTPVRQTSAGEGRKMSFARSSSAASHQPPSRTAKETIAMTRYVRGSIGL